MKKAIISLMVAVLGLGISGISFAQKESPASAKPEQARLEVLKGKIVSIDNAKNEVTIQDRAGVEKTLLCKAKQLASLKQGEEVKVSLKADGKTIKSIKVVSKKHHQKIK